MTPALRRELIGEFADASVPAPTPESTEAGANSDPRDPADVVVPDRDGTHKEATR